MLQHHKALLNQGYRIYHTSEYGAGRSLTLSKQRLGLFFNWLIRLNGQMLDMYCPKPEVKNGFVLGVVLIHPDKKKELENNTGVWLVSPPELLPDK